MSDDMIMHFSNSSNQSDQSSKIAKLEARLVGKPSSAVASQPQVQSQLNSWPAPANFGGAPDSLPESVLDSDDSDDDVSIWILEIVFPFIFCFWPTNCPHLTELIKSTRVK